MLGKETRRCLAHCLPLNHAKGVFLVNFDSGTRFGGPLVKEELVEDGEGFRTTLGFNLELLHCFRESCFS